MPGRQDGLKLAVAALSGAVVTGVGSYLTLGQNIVHADELHAAINESRAERTAQLDKILEQMKLDDRDDLYLRDMLAATNTQIGILQQEITEIEKDLKTIKEHTAG